jgi:hypothetical protein
MNVPLFYCDHNFVSNALQASSEYREHLRALVRQGTIRFVLSPMHWVDAAEDADVERGNSKSDFMDSLTPDWLLDRRSIQRNEVASEFFRFLKIPRPRATIMGTIADIIHDLVGQKADRSSRSFVNHIRKIGANHPLEKAIQQAFDTNRKNTEYFESGKINESLAENIQRRYVQGLIPKVTPSGLTIDETSKKTFAQEIAFDSLPSIALEHAATRDNWTHGRDLTRNNFVDQQHLIALPYVDFFITDDKKLTSLATRITTGVGYRIGNLLTKAEFDNLYPKKPSA